MDFPKDLCGRNLKCFEFTSKALHPEAKILNIGCSDGWLEKYLSNAYKRVLFFACEIDSKKLKGNDIENVFFIAASGLKLPFCSGYFDIVTFFDVIEHVPRLTEPIMLKEIHRVLKPDGEILMSTPRKSKINNLTDPAWYFGHRHYSISVLKNLLDSVGLKMISYESQGCMYELIDMWCLYLWKWVIRKDVPDWIRKKIVSKFSITNKVNGGLSIFLKAQKN